jgi:hypothetical protein
VLIAIVSTLQGAIEQARLMIEGDVVELMARATGEGRDRKLEGHSHSEWPLPLKGWWIGGESMAALHREDVKHVEDDYVRNMSKSLEKFFIS